MMPSKHRNETHFYNSGQDGIKSDNAPKGIESITGINGMIRGAGEG
jgi:hypothetical protein